ncbi:hypothetical protein ABPG72_020528 [Tetrahymena utriculariae]
MANLIIAQASKSQDIFQQKLINNSQSSQISIQFQHIKQQSKEYLDLLAIHLKNYQHYQDVQIKISKNTLIRNEGYQILAQALKTQTKAQIVNLYLEESCNVGFSGVAYLSEALINLEELQDLTIIIDGCNYIQNIGLECLAKVFPQLQNLKKLHIQIAQPNRYDQIGVIAICESIKLFKQLDFLKLDIDGRKVNKLGVQAISSVFESLTNLQNLDFKFRYLFGQINGIKELAISLGSLVNLKFLSFYIFQENTINSEIQMELSNSLRNLNKLESLFLDDLYYFQDEQSIIHFADIFSHKYQLKNLNLKIESSKIHGQYVAVCLAEKLKKLINLTDFTIKIQDNCNIKAEGTYALAEAISNMENLTELQIIIKICNQIGQKGAISIGDALGKLAYLQSLKLIIEDNNFINQEGAQAIAEGIEKLSNLVDLDVQINENNFINNGFRSQSAQQLGMAFQSLTQLENLNLEIGDFNQINQEGAKYLAEGIKFLLNLTHFEFLLDNYNIQKQGAISIGNCLQYLINLRVLFLQINQDKIESDGAISIGTAIKYLTGLTQLNLKIGNQNQIKQIGACAIGQGMESLTNLTDLNLVFQDSNDIQTSGLSSICKAISKMHDLQYISLLFGNQNLIESSSLKQLPSSIQLLKNVGHVGLSIHLSEISQNFVSDVFGLIKLLDLQSINFKYALESKKIVNFISDINSYIQIDSDYDKEDKYKNISTSIESINQIPQIKSIQLEVVNNNYEQISFCSNLGDSLKNLQLLEKLDIKAEYLDFSILDLGKDDNGLLDKFVYINAKNKDAVKKPIIESHDEILKKVQEIHKQVELIFDSKVAKTSKFQNNKGLKRGLKNSSQLIDLEVDESFSSEAEEPLKKKYIKKEKEIAINIQNLKQNQNSSSNKLKAKQRVSNNEDDLEEDQQRQTQAKTNRKNKAKIIDELEEHFEIKRNSNRKSKSKTASNESSISQEAPDKQDIKCQNNKINKSNNEEQKEFVQSCQLLEEQLKYWMIKHKGDFSMAKSIQNDTDGFDIEILGFKTLGKEKMPYVLFLPQIKNIDKLGVDLQDHFKTIIASKDNINQSEALERILLLPTFQQFELILKCVQKCIPKKESKSKQKNQKRKQKFKQLRDELNSLKDKQDKQNDE